MYGNATYDSASIYWRGAVTVTQARSEGPGAKAKRERLEARLTQEQKRVLMRAAALQGRSLTDFVVSSAQEAALRVIEVHESIRLGERDRRAFVDALLNPRAPGKRLRTAARRFKLDTVAMGPPRKTSDAASALMMT